MMGTGGVEEEDGGESLLCICIANGGVFLDDALFHENMLPGVVSTILSVVFIHHITQPAS